ncbi:MAG: hypothetical protein IJ009_00740 [Clostridia bacterium]|nr:hypothetical protein [Clostridia bacterium]
MFGFFKRKREEEYRPQFETEGTAAEELDLEEILAEAEEVEQQGPYADLEPGEVIEAPEEDGETVRLEDGRELSAAFVREIRALRAEELKLIIEEQKMLYSPEEFAYICEVFAERLGD